MTQIENKTLRAAIAPALLMGAIWFARSNKYCVQYFPGGGKHLLQTAACGSAGLFVGSFLSEDACRRRFLAISLMALGLFAYPKAVRSINQRINMSYTPSFYLFVAGSTLLGVVEYYLSPRLTVVRPEGCKEPIPKNIDEILNTNCPFHKGKKVKETHCLVYIPDGYTLNVLKDSTNSITNSEAVLKKIGDESISPGYWALMTKEIIPGSLESSIKELNKQLKKYSDYEMPSALAVATLFAYGTRISGVPKNWICCSDELGEEVLNKVRVQLEIENGLKKLKLENFAEGTLSSDCKSVGLIGFRKLPATKEQG